MTNRTELPLEELRARFHPLFAEIARGARKRDRDGELAHAEVAALKSAGFGTLLVPAADGGLSASYETFAALLIDLATADPSIAQAFRSHFHVVESIVAHPAGEFRDRWLGEILGGALFSNGVTDARGTPAGRSSAVIDRSGELPSLSGVKEYSTGNLFAEWLLVIADKGEAAPEVVIVPVADPGVSVEDGWNGFGQRSTSTGRSRFERVPLHPWQFLTGGSASAHRGDILQLILLAVLAGIARSAANELGDAVRGRDRAYSHGAAAVAAADPQVLETVGEVVAAAFTAEALVLRLAQESEELRRGASASGEAQKRAVAHVYAAQSVLPRLVLEASTRLFDALGASATDRDRALDRHWRNARTVASHNPQIYRRRLLGGWQVTGDLDTAWNVGTASATPVAPTTNGAS